MKVGLDTFTLHPAPLPDAFAYLRFCVDHELEGAQFGGVNGISPALDTGKFREVQREADRLGLYCFVSVSSPNPCLSKQSADDLYLQITREIEACAAVGWRELHSTLGGLDERHGKPQPWPQQLAASTAMLRRLAPVLRRNGCRINLEDHGETTTFELVRIAEEIGPDVAGICLDTANVLCNAEDPLWAIRRAAPYTHQTHTKDGIIYFTANGYTRQGRPPGQGVIPWEEALTILGHFNPDLCLSIEDHKWVWEFRIFDEDWLALFPDVTPRELGRVCKLAWQCSEKIARGEIPDPAEYEKIPFKDQLIERLHFGRDYLKRTLDKLGLRSPQK